MKKEEFEKLPLEIQEYIQYCINIGIINTINKDIIMDRLSRTILDFDVKDKRYGGNTSIKNDEIKVEICKEQIQKEADKMGRSYEIAFYETLFHELFHVSSYTDVEMDKETKKLFPDKDDSKYPYIFSSGYGVVNEFIAQTIAQKIIMEKYKEKVSYPTNTQTFTFNENGYIPDDLAYSYQYTSNLVFYGEIESIALKFIKCLYGKKDLEKLYNDHFNRKIFDRIEDNFRDRNDSMQNLYDMFGNMGNILALDCYQQGYYGNERYTFFNVDRFKKSINEFNRIVDIEIDKRTKNNDEIDEEYEDEMEEYYDFDYYDDLAYYEEQDEKLRKEFEKNIMRDDVVDYYKSLTIEDIDYYFGPYFVRMIGYDQNNSHHCYDLWTHTLKTVEGIKPDGLTQDQFKKLRIAALFHDIGKPDVAKINEETGQQVYYGHAMRSAETANFLLESFGYSQEDIAQIEFYISHHDDFISYRSNLPENMKKHEFIREINVDSITEKIIENKYDFEKMGYNKDEIRAIVYTLVHGEEPEFKNFKGEKISIPINIEEVNEKINSGEYNVEYESSLEDYKMLLKLCKADANAQAEKAERILPDGKIVVDVTKKDKLENMSNIENLIPQAYEKVMGLIRKQSIKRNKGIGIGD